MLNRDSTFFKSSVDLNQFALMSTNPPQFYGGLGITLLFGVNKNENEAEKRK